MKKVGVVTFHNAYNFGACLQTWALQQALKTLDVEPCVIHYHIETMDRLYDPIKKKNPVLKFLKYIKLKLRAPYRLERVKNYEAFFATHYNRLGNFKTSEGLKKAKLPLDTLIVGSDQVWNGSHTNGYDEGFFLQFGDSQMRRISYSASLGKEDFDEDMKDNVKKAFKSFDAISVRESSSKDNVKKLAGRIPVFVCPDPTLLLEKEDYEALKKPVSLKNTKDGHYILLYMMEKNEQLIELGNRVSKELGLPIVQRSAKQIFENEAENLYTHTPDEFLSVVEGADVVLTNSFHGTVFASIYEKPFLTSLHSNTGARTKDLMKELGLEKHLLLKLSDYKDAGDFYLTGEEVERLRENKKRMKQAGMEFLQTYV